MNRSQDALRAIFVIDETPVREAHGRVISRLTELLDGFAARCSVSLALLRGESEVVDGVREKGHTVFPLNFTHYWDAPKAVLRLARAMRSQSPDVVVGHEVIPAIISGTAARLSRPVVAEFVRFHTFGGLKLNGASRTAAALCDHTVAVSRSVARFAETLDRSAPERIHVAYSGRASTRAVSVSEIEALKSELGIGADAPVVTVVSRLRYEKGIDIAIRAVDIASRNVATSLELVIVGSGPDEARLRSVARAHPAVRTHFVGHQDDVSRYFALGDVVLVPSRKEAFGYTPVEAMSAGKPVVGTDVGGLPEIVADGETGFLVPPEDPEQMADRLCELLLSRDLRRRMGEAARARFAAMFTMQARVERFTDIWMASTNRIPRIHEFGEHRP